MRDILIKINIIRVISGLKAEIRKGKKKTLPNLQYSLTHLLVYRFTTSILMEEALSLGALTTAANRLIFR